MIGKMRAQPIRGTRSTQNKGGKASRTQPRNITRWSANKDIALLCALTKECRKDKFRISWDRVAKWIGPNVTGGAIEQHVAKLYSKLKEHRSSQEPKRKKRKNASYTDEDDNEGDYVEDEETWNKGNEAFANIFYASPDASSGMLDDENDFDFDQAAHARDFYHKESSANYQEEYDDDENDRGGLMHAAQSYGGMGARQSFQEGYGGLGGPGEGIRSAPLHHGYADPPSEGGHSNYSIDYMQQNSAYPPSNQFNSDSLEQLGPSISGNLQGGMIPMGPPHRQRSGIVYQSPQARPAGLNIHNMNQTDSQSPAIEQWDDQSSWNLANINNAANSFTYHGGHTASQNPLLGNQPPFQTVQGHLSSPTHGTSEFQNKFIADNMDQATNQMLLAQSHTRPNIRGSLLADNKRAPPGLISPAASNAGNITVKVEPGMETTNRDTAGQGRITGSLPTRFSSHASSQSQAPGNSPQPATMQYWFGRLRQQSTSSFQDGLSQENHEPTASVSATTSTALPSAQTHANDQASIGGLAGGDQQYNKYADSDPTFFSQFLNDDEEFGLN